MFYIRLCITFLFNSNIFLLPVYLKFVYTHYTIIISDIIIFTSKLMNALQIKKKDLVCLLNILNQQKIVIIIECRFINKIVINGANI